MVKKVALLIPFLAVVFAASVFAGTIRFPDTGVTKCYDSAGAEIPCAGTGQDGAYIINSMSFTDNGDGTVTDNNTGLMWQKEDDGIEYNWYKASGMFHVVRNPSSQSVCGSLTLGGYSDWRLPAKKELVSIVKDGVPYPGPTIDAAYFPGTKSDNYWSSTTFADYPDYAWAVNFLFCGVGGIGKSSVPHVRCVRGEQLSFGTFFDNFDGTVTDNGTGLTWQQDEAGYMTWDSALSYCEELSLGGHSDWRLPNFKELESITDDSRYNPAVDINFFPGASFNWSSTSETLFVGPSYARTVEFYEGRVYFGIKNDNSPVRCVRGGGVVTGKVTLTINKDRPEDGIVKSSDNAINCGAVCSAEYDVGTTITLTANGAYGSGLFSWSGGGCSGTGSCTLTITENTTVTASFINFVEVMVPAYNIAKLVPNEPGSALDNRIPLILIHGIHGTKDSNENEMLDDEEILQDVGWSAFSNYYNNSSLNDLYKIYRFHYLSDVQNVSEIGLALRRYIDESINRGDMNDSPVVIVAHSMGGLVARSYMQEHEGCEKTKKLISLATPHHGTPGANTLLRTKLANNADGNKDNRWYLPFWIRLNPTNSWSGTVGVSSLYYWKTSSTNEPNREDLLWDNFDHIYKDSRIDVNVWLRDTLNADASCDDKLIVYSGYLDTSSERYRNLVNRIYVRKPSAGPQILLAEAGIAELNNDKHGKLLCSGIVLNRGLYKEIYLFENNDGMVPLQSANFEGHAVEKRECYDHDHVDMRGETKTPEKICRDGKTLLKILEEDLIGISSL